MKEHPRPLEMPGLIGRVAPFAGVALAALVAIPLSPQKNDGVIAAAGLAAAVVASIVLLPWRRLPAWTQAVPPLSYFAAVALLRHAQGGATSAYTPLFLLPIIWFALYGTRTELFTSLGLAGVLSAAPIVVFGEPHYPIDEWGRIFVWLATGTMTGMTVQALVKEVHRRAEESELRARTIGAVAKATRRIAMGVDARKGICQGAREVSGSSFAALLEPESDGYLGAHYLRITASDGIDIPPTRIQIGGEPSGAVVAYTSGRQFLVQRALGHPAVSQRMVAMTQAKSVVYQPVVRGGEVIGVLVASWSEEIDEIASEAASAIELLAGEAAIAIERSDLHKQLERLASTDVLTGLANRRTWNEHLARELSRARRSKKPFTVALLDIDYFKKFNDSYGHQAGDRLLKMSAAAWGAQLREVDLLARIGGDEFAVILPDCSPDEAQEVAQRMRAVMPERQSCSVGIAGWNGRGSADDLLKQADAALYEAKNAGRNRISMWTERPPAVDELPEISA